MPAVLDILRRVEKRLKRCLCVSELAGHYRPQLMAYALMHLELEHVLAQIDEPTVQTTLSNTLEALKSIGKLSYEEIDKCKHQIVEHVSCDCDEEDDQYAPPNLWQLPTRFYRSYGMSPLLYNVAATSLDVIEEVDEEADEETHQQQHATAAANINDISTSSSASSLSFMSTSPSFTYADVVLGRQIDSAKKRKLDEHHFNYDDDEIRT